MCNFHLKENGTTFGREILAGLVTFVTMSYIICVQPAVLSGGMFGMDTGLDTGALLTTTCLISAIGSILMGLMSRYPLGLAPGMGENFFLVLTLMPAVAQILGGHVGDMPVFRLALGCIFFSGVIFFIISLLRVRELLFDQVSGSVKSAIGVGLGLFIAFIGMKNAGLIQVVEGQLQFGSLVSHQAQIFLVGLVVTFIFLARKKPWGILPGIIAAGVTAYFLGELKWNGCFGLPANPLPVTGQIDYLGVWRHLPQLAPFVFVLLFMKLFDTFGTIVGVAEQGHLMKGGSLPRIERVFTADATATVIGALLGQSTVTSYIESLSGIAVGGRTGLTAITVGVCFLLALFFSPLIMAVASCSAVTASALVVVGVMMTAPVRNIKWDDWTESVPAFLAIAGIPFTGSIAMGILMPLIFYPFGKLFAGRVRETTVCGWVIAVLLAAYVIFIRV